MKRSDDIEKLAEALAAAQGEIEAAVKDKENPHFRSRYADLASIWDACRGPLSSHGLAVIQTTEQGKRLFPDGPPGILLETTLAHSSGQWISGVIPVYCDTRNPQQIGSALTYARRYGLAAIVGVCPDDDDAEAAVQPQREHQGRQQAQRGRERAEPRRDATPATKPPASEPTTKEVKRFEEEVRKFCDRMNAAWIDRHTSEHGLIPSWVKDLANSFQIVGHMLKRAGVPTGRNYGERMKAATAIWLADEAGTAKEWRTYVKGIADDLEQEHAETEEPVAVGAGREPGADDDR